MLSLTSTHDVVCLVIHFLSAGRKVGRFSCVLHKIPSISEFLIIMECPTGREVDLKLREQ